MTFFFFNMRLILFDIDGTLLHVDEGSRTAVIKSIEHVTGQVASLKNISFSGRTDPDIFRDVLDRNGLPSTDNVLANVLNAYTEIAQSAIQAPNVRSLPGAASVLSLLSNRSDIFLGLVTGNVEPIAFHKLKAAGFDGYFSVGGFGSDHANRSKLPALAIRRATEYAGHPFSAEHTVIIGDTGHDVACAKDSGTRSVAVCTGRADSVDLTRHNPDLLLENLQEPDGVIERLLAV